MSNVGDPCKYAAAVVPSDVTDFPSPARSIYVGVSGNIVAIVNGVPITFNNVPVGVLPVQCSRINLSGTTALQMVAMW